MQDLVERYIKLRDAKAKLKAKFKADTETLDRVMGQIEAVILAKFETDGVTSMTTGEGTAYKSTRTFAKVEDWEATLAFIKANDLWNMLERRVSKEAVVQWREENSDIPPGLSWSEEVTINVRRS